MSEKNTADEMSRIKKSRKLSAIIDRGDSVFWSHANFGSGGCGDVWTVMRDGRITGYVAQVTYPVGPGRWKRVEGLVWSLAQVSGFLAGVTAAENGEIV